MTKTLTPYFTFTIRQPLYEGLALSVSDAPVAKWDEVASPNFRERPWEFYARTMLFGPELVKEYGLDKLLAAPAYRIIELPGPSVLIHGPGGFFDNQPLDVKPEDSWRDEDDILEEYDAGLAGYLGFALDLTRANL